jgi:hypothetical protein
VKSGVRESLRTPVVGSYDVVVVGGGVAGAAAAVAAARAGARALLLEKGVMLGGLATLGLIAWYEPLCDGRGRKVMGGMAEELLHLSIRYGYDTLPEHWRGRPARVAAGPAAAERYHTRFNPCAFVVALDEWVRDAGVDLLFDTVFARPIMRGRRCEAVAVEHKGGRAAFAAGVVVDATGDAEVFAKAGAPCTCGQNWLTYTGYTTSLEAMRAAVEGADVRLAIKLKTWGSNRLGKGHPEAAARRVGLDARDVTGFILEGRGLLRREMAAADSRSSAVIAIPAMAQFRTTRRIVGLARLTEADEGRRAEDSIACVSDFSREGPVYEIPYGSLLSEGFDNLITAGRSIDAEGHAWEVSRVIPPAVLTGQAAGTAAAAAASRRCTVRDVPIGPLQADLARSGVVIHWHGEPEAAAPLAVGQSSAPP